VGAQNQYRPGQKHTHRFKIQNRGKDGCRRPLDLESNITWTTTAKNLRPTGQLPETPLAEQIKSVLLTYTDISKIKSLKDKLLPRMPAVKPGRLGPRHTVKMRPQVVPLIYGKGENKLLKGRSREIFKF
jgi:hypothetical protein